MRKQRRHHRKLIGDHGIDAILLLGGDSQRERLTAEVAAGNIEASSYCRALSDNSALEALADSRVPIFISSGHGNVGEVFLSAGVNGHRARVDTRATDTVSNFTTMAPGLKEAGYQHIAVVTSDYHVHRAECIAREVFRALGMAYTMCSLPSSTATSQQMQESTLRAWRDRFRIRLWLLCGVDLGFLGRLSHPERFWHRPVSAFDF